MVKTLMTRAAVGTKKAIAINYLGHINGQVMRVSSSLNSGVLLELGLQGK